jgi:hypothetical protein
VASRWVQMASPSLNIRTGIGISISMIINNTSVMKISEENIDENNTHIAMCLTPHTHLYDIKLVSHFPFCTNDRLLTELLHS